MADICDQHGNPIQLTDELGRPVQLTDEFGRPMHLTGVATTEESGPHTGTTIGSDLKTHDTPMIPEAVLGGAGVEKAVPGDAEGEKQQFGRSGSSSSSSSEDDGQGGRRKKNKKGLMQKIKEKLPGHKNKEEKAPEMVYTATTKISVTTPPGPPGEPKPEFIGVEYHEEEHEKKGLMDKIMDKLPGHHH
ncbi:hypothetical protein L2E82_37130 [Cichorium intybus]|uniref:Uncharacterized protein n=1 Tax=Cichorium intybus TaxID=13427 RepID=A0ACB9AF06_CICIN|nr:hypothetical protein L2E82_37130 [Cichorium intybus]